MSASFTGVTFAKQKISPSDDAIVRRAILTDGKLTGCNISYSGSTLTISAGHLMVCGRQIRLPFAQNWPIMDASSGFARLVLTIDLTRTASKETFDQVVDSIEYASAEDGFLELEQSDINASGTRYQVAVCVVSLGPGGITGIVSQLEKSVADGSGGLNFKLVGGVTQPTGPKENTIWVNTAQKITNSVFSATQPAEPEEGMVWILTGVSSQVAFSATKKSLIMVYPISAKQYLGGQWMDVTAKSYQGGQWVDWWNGELYKDGNQFESVTGGWIGTPAGLGADSNVKGTAGITAGASTLQFKNTKTGGVIYHPAKKIDLTNYSTLIFDGVAAPNSSGAVLYFSVWTDLGSYFSSNRVKNTQVTASNDGEISLDVSDLIGEYVVGFGLYTTSPSIEMRSMLMR